MRTSLHDADISSANFDFVDETFLSALKQFSEYGMPSYGWGVQGTDPGSSEREQEVKQFDCDVVMRNLQVEFMQKFDNPLYNQSCAYMFRRGLFSGGLEEIQALLDHWSSQEMGYYDISYNKENTIYGRQVSITLMATTYAIFYDLFENHQAINAFFKQWLLSNERNRKHGEKRCPFSYPRNYRTQGAYVVDACGSNHWRAAVSNIALGLRLQDRDLYISGIKHLEINLSMYDKDGIFVPYASRGWDAPGYAIDNDEHIGAVALMLETAGINLYAVRTSSGQTVQSLVEGNQAWLRDPEIASDYILGTLTCNATCEMFNDFSQAGSLDQWKQDKIFTEQDILLRSFHYQLKYHPDRFPNTLDLASVWTEYNTLPGMYVWGQNNGFPLIFATMSRAGELGDYMASIASNDAGSDEQFSENNNDQINDRETQQQTEIILSNLGLIVRPDGQVGLVGDQMSDIRWTNPNFVQDKIFTYSIRYDFEFGQLIGQPSGMLDSQFVENVNDLFSAASPSYYLMRDDGKDEISAWVDIDHILGRSKTAKANWDKIQATCPIEPDMPYDTIEIPIQNKASLLPSLVCMNDHLDDQNLIVLIQLLVVAGENMSGDMFP